LFFTYKRRGGLIREEREDEYIFEVKIPAAVDRKKLTKSMIY